MTIFQKVLVVVFILFMILVLFIAQRVDAATPRACILERSLSSQVGGVIIGGQFFPELSIADQDFPEADPEVLNQLGLTSVWGYVMMDTEVRPIIFYFTDIEAEEDQKVYLAILDDPRLPGVFNQMAGSWKRACLLDVSATPS